MKAATDKKIPLRAGRDRIATFDQDGTLWVEHPIYTQAAFALDRVPEPAPAHPEWKRQEPLRSVLAGDPDALGKLSESDSLPNTKVGRFPPSLMDEALESRRHVISIKNDWKHVFP